MDPLDDLVSVKLIREIIDWSTTDPLLARIADPSNVYLCGHSRVRGYMVYGGTFLQLRCQVAHSPENTKRGKRQQRIFFIFAAIEGCMIGLFGWT